MLIDDQKDKKIIKVNVNGRVMIDPATFRRLRPNYQFSSIIRDDKDLLSDSESEGEIEEIDEESSSSDDDASQSDPLKDDSDTRDAKEYKKWKKNHKKKLVRDPDNPEGYHIIWVKINKRVPEDVEALPKQPAEEDSTTPSFTDEEYLIANPVALGFSFSEKMWLEFAVSGINEIQWNAGAFDSLIIPDDQKTVVRALVESHAFEAKKNIDDVIQGKGRGLVAVLHGPPGTGKTLTAEGIAELLRKPLYVKNYPPTISKFQLIYPPGRISRRTRHPKQRRRTQPEPNPRRGTHLGRASPPRRSGRLPRGTHKLRRQPQRPRLHLPPNAGILPGHTISYHQPRHGLRPCVRE